MGNMCERSESPKDRNSSLQMLGKLNLDSPSKQEVPTLVQTPSPRKKQDKSDFLLLGLVGKGAFGIVYKVMKKDTGKIYAMKELSKQIISDHNLESSSFLERNVLKSSDFPFIVKLRFSFQSVSKCYFVMDFVSGGELFKIMQQTGALAEPIVKFLAAEIVLALEYLHCTLKVIYRDLKPENILLSDSGHVKLTDFGLATYIKDENTYTMAGTPEYLAPEIISRAGHSYEVDFWTLGVLIYEMLSGYAPFSHPDRNLMAIQQLIMKNRPVFSQKISSHARNLISGLLKFNPKERLGAKSFDQLKSHSFFKGIDFSLLQNLQIPSPLESYTKKNSGILSAALQPIKDAASPHVLCKELENFSYDPELEDQNILK